VYTRNRNLFVGLAKRVFSDVVARLNPTDIILNVGFHGGGIDDSEVAENNGRVFKYELKGEFSNVSHTGKYNSRLGWPLAEKILRPVSCVQRR